MRVIVPVDGGRDCREAIRFIASKKEWFEQEKPEVELIYVQKPIVERATEQAEFNLGAYYEAQSKAVWSGMREEIDAIPGEVKKDCFGGAPCSSYSGLCQ